MRKGAGAIVGVCALLALSGCIERRIRVTSEPSGARVYLNDEPIGTTPCEARFTFYGTYDVRVELDGYEPIHEPRTAHAPLHEYPGIDFVATALPVEFENVIEWDFVMVPVEETTDPEGAREHLIERADELRARAISGE
jgi:hypothetical protein